MTIKSPFLIIKDFLSPLECEEILQIYDWNFNNVNENGKPIKSIVPSPLYSRRIWNHLEDCFDDIQEYYDIDIKHVDEVYFEWYPENCVDEGLRCENSIYNNGKWSIVNRNDFSVIIFLKDYCISKDIDPDYECYGGQLEMINHKFKFSPERGTAIIFPSNQYFVNRTIPSKVGDVCQIRTHITCEQLFNYNPSDFQGDYTLWFREL